MSAQAGPILTPITVSDFTTIGCVMGLKQDTVRHFKSIYEHALFGFYSFSF